MSVIIKGMSSYGCCADCEFCGGLIMPDDIYVCDCPPTRGMDITRAIEEDCKHPDCQLVELPEKHGRLIDKDALIREHFSPEHRIALSEANKTWMRKIINDTPTIVEAEGEEGEK